jgi:hypothetical protein
MPIDYSFENIPSFRDLTHTGLILLKRPLVRSLAKLRRLQGGSTDSTPPMGTAGLVPVPVKSSRQFRRSPLSGSL